MCLQQPPADIAAGTAPGWDPAALSSPMAGCWQRSATPLQEPLHLTSMALATSRAQGRAKASPERDYEGTYSPLPPPQQSQGPTVEHTGSFTETQEMSGKEKGSDVVCKAAVQHLFWQAKAKINTLLQVPRLWASPGWKSLIVWPTRACSYHSALGFQGFF